MALIRILKLCPSSAENFEYSVVENVLFNDVVYIMHRPGLDTVEGQVIHQKIPGICEYIAKLVASMGSRLRSTEPLDL